MIEWIICQQDGQPWWVSVLTGTGSAVVLLTFGVIALWRKLAEKEKENQDLHKENNETGKQFVELSIKILERDERTQQNDAEIKQGIQQLIEHIKDTSTETVVWRDKVMSLLQSILGRHGKN